MERGRRAGFAEEKPRLVPLPRHPCDTARVLYRVCSIDGFVDWEGNRYAVPYDHITTSCRYVSHRPVVAPSSPLTAGVPRRQRGRSTGSS